MTLALLGVIMLIIAGLCFLSLGLHGRLMAIRDGSEITAQCAADAALTQALIVVNQKLKARLWSDRNLPAATSQPLQNSDAIYSYHVAGDFNTGYVLEGVGQSGRAVKAVSAKLKLDGLYDYAIFADQQIVLKSGGILDGYDSRLGPYGGTNKNVPVVLGLNSSTPCAIEMYSGTTIVGAVLGGPGTDPNNYRCGDMGTITDGISSAMITRDLPIIPAPTLTYKGASPPDVISASGKYDTINILTKKTVSVVGNVVLHVTGNVTLKQGAELQITPGSSLQLYVDGVLTIGQYGIINNTTQDPKNLAIYGSAVGVEHSFGQATVFYGTLYAPGASLQLNNSADLYGSFVTKLLSQNAKVNMHYDMSLGEVNITDIGVKFVVDRWSEGTANQGYACGGGT
jgi:hypothetical protein